MRSHVSCLGEQSLIWAEDKLKESEKFRQPDRAERQGEDQSNLSSRLSSYRRESSLRRPDFAKAYDELVARLDGIDRGEVAAVRRVDELVSADREVVAELDQLELGSRM